MAKRSFPPRLITIHGTGDTTNEETGPRWWQQNGSLQGRLRERLGWGDHSLSPDLVRPFIWDGANSEISRLNAARRLSTFIVQHALTFDLHIVAHSHGGNILRAALSDLRDLGYEAHRRAIRSITTVGTPFFIYDSKKSATYYLVMMALGIGITLTGIALFAWAVTDIAAASVTAFQTLAFLTKVTLAILCLFLGYISTALAGFQWNAVQSKRKQPELFCEWACVHSKADEAMIALAAVKGSIKLGGTGQVQAKQLVATGIETLQVSMTILVAGLTAVISVAIAFVPMTFIPPSANPWLLFLPLGLAITFFSVVARLIFSGELIQHCVTTSRQLAGSVSAWFSNILNRIANRQIASAAFGDDCNAGIVGVSVLPWPNAGAPIVCAGELHISLEQQVQTGVSETLGAVRARLSVDEKRKMDLSAFRSLLSWNELAHTAYFKNDEFLTMLCERLEAAQSEGRPQATPAGTVQRSST